MFRELRKPRGDPEVLAAQSKEQYFKASVSVFGSTSAFSFQFTIFVFLILETYRDLIFQLLGFSFAVKEQAAIPHTWNWWCWFSVSLYFLFS